MSEPKQVVYVLGGGIVQENGHWRTTLFEDTGDKYGALGDRLRVDAAIVLYKENPDSILLVVSGGRGQLRDMPDAPTIASVLFEELQVEGVPKEALYIEDRSDNTYEQLQQLKKLIKEHGWKNVKVLSNRWHLPRIEAFIETDKELFRLFEKAVIVTVGAEDILIDKDSARWKDVIAKEYVTPHMQERMKLEAQGVESIKNGTYQLS